ncbi:MAG TPA: ComEC family competence protein [Rickettsia endosymbiont of Pyrocoelia pectoralis]|nr:ComEC family competence protein [Rickettsia endosymbiont of Pyrocoelia pectoralis]
MLYYIKTKFEAEYDNLNLWYFVSFICGIVVYFTLRFNYSFSTINISLLSFLILSISRKYINNLGKWGLIDYSIIFSFICKVIIAFIFGIVISKNRTMNLHAQTLHKPIITEVSGKIESIKPTIIGGQIVLNEIKIQKINRNLQKVKISVPKKYLQEIRVNDYITVLAKLYKPQNSILPGGYDFGFYAYLADIGANGYAMSEPKIIERKETNIDSFIHKIRIAIYDNLIGKLGKDKGNFAAAILLGETKGLNRQIMQDMRQSGISHVLCVSGLHLSLVVMIFFLTSRFLLNLSNYLAYNYNIKLLSAYCSLIESFGYLVLSGMQIAATRAFITAAILIYGIIIGRSCFPLRSLAIAAFIILSLNPEYIFHPSFQLSFIAVLSLVAGFEFYLKNSWFLGENKGIFGAVKFYVASNIYSSFLASIITAPVVINQFFIFSTYSVPANLIVVPITSFFLMPLALLSLPFTVIGFDSYILKIIGFFIDLIIKTAHYFNNLPGSVWYFGYITNFSILLFLFGFFWICIWKTTWRLFGLAIMAVSFIFMLYSPKPELIFDVNNMAVGVKNKQGKLEIYADKMPAFNRVYWANWFGQQDSRVLPLKDNIFTTDYEQKIALNKNNFCQKAEIQINLNYKAKCKGKLLTINENFLRKSPVILIFCNLKECTVKSNNANYTENTKNFFKRI